MQYRFDKHLEALLPEHNRTVKILAAVSGGADSMCLLDLLCNSKLDISVSIAHVNFHLRGEESCKDEALVREWAEDHGVKIFVKQIDTVAYAKERSLSIEMAARELRYSWFNELMSEHGFDYVAVAHHANDNAETLLLNLLRGTGIKGICGMKEMDYRSHILRPLLSSSRQQIEQYVAKKAIPYRTDHTNLEVEYYRNRIRNVVMPQLQSINPSVIATFNSNMRNFSQAAGIVEEFVGQKRETLVKKDCKIGSAFLKAVKSPVAKEYIIRATAPSLECYISVKELLGERHWRYLLYEILAVYAFNPDQIEDFAIVLQAEQRESKKIVSPTHIAVLERGFMKIYKNNICVTTDNSMAIPEFEKEKEISFNGRVLKLRKLPIGEALTLYEQMKECNLLTLMLDADKLIYPLVLQRIEHGLKWQPFGMNGIKKLSDYLMDLKIDSLLKQDTAVLYNGSVIESGLGAGKGKENPGNIICLPGLQISNLYRVTENSSSALIISLT